MEKLNNINQLISESMKFESKDERIKYVMNYFLNSVNYDYAYLFAKGYMQGTISRVESGFRLIESKLENNDITEVVLTREIQAGSSKIFSDILKLQDKSQGEYNVFIQYLNDYVKNELKQHIENQEVVDRNTKKFIDKVENDLLYKKEIITMEEEQYELNYDISSVLIEYLLNDKKNFPPIIQDGLIKSGVCDSYSDYLLSIMKKIDIEAHKIDGTSEMNHAWIIVKGDNNYKSIDLTRAIFIRDGFLGIPKEQASQDWLFCDIDKMFDMQETRTIVKIDGIELPNIITSENYNENDFLKVINSNSKLAEQESILSAQEAEIADLDKQIADLNKEQK